MQTKGVFWAIWWGLTPLWLLAQKPAASTPADTLPPAARIYAGWLAPLGTPVHIPDSLAPDSVRILFLPASDTVLMTLDQVHRWDEALEMPGFLQHTGILGKPVNTLRLGLRSRYLGDAGDWVHPLSAQPDPYFFLPEHTPVYDAHRPLVHVHFNQSSFNTQLLRVTLSQNLQPWWNSTLHYRRRTATGLYANQVTDHYNIYWNHWLHSRDFRWQLFGGLLWQQQNDGLNGGISTTGDAPLSDLFEGISTTVQLRNASLYQRHRAVWVQAYGQPLNWLGLRLAGKTQDFVQVMADPVTYTAADLNSTLYRPYPQLLAAEGKVGYGLTLREHTASGGLAISSRAPFLQDTLYLEGDAGQLRLPQAVLRAPGGALTRYAVAARWQGHFRRLADETPLLQLTLHFRWADNSLQAPTRQLAAAVTWTSRPRVFSLLDSSAIDTINYRIAAGLRKPKIYQGSWVPWQATVAALQAGYNPSLQEVYWQTLTFAGNPGLVNEQVFSLQGHLRHTWGKPRMRRGLAFRQNYLELGGFASRVTTPIYYTHRMQVMQAAEDASYRWLGVSLAQQQRLGRFYLQSDLTAQQGYHTADVPALEPYANDRPALYGNARFFWESKLFRTPADFQLGVEASGFTAFRGFALDPSLQVWYPQYTQELPAYMQLNAWFALRIQRTFIYVKMLHANQGLMAPGYFTTPFHPMQPRAFNFGVSWQFND
ncbi:MAG: hypothetical protein KF690_00295 [Bacteroidetes bacterium]|nr:hypothetical protein [Bacteroidota bacterium]